MLTQIIRDSRGAPPARRRRRRHCHRRTELSKRRRQRGKNQGVALSYRLPIVTVHLFICWRSLVCAITTLPHPTARPTPLHLPSTVHPARTACARHHHPSGLERPQVSRAVSSGLERSRAVSSGLERSRARLKRSRAISSGSRARPSTPPREPVARADPTPE